MPTHLFVEPLNFIAYGLLCLIRQRNEEVYIPELRDICCDLSKIREDIISESPLSCIQSKPIWLAAHSFWLHGPAPGLHIMCTGLNCSAS